MENTENKPKRKKNISEKVKKDKQFLKNFFDVIQNPQEFKDEVVDIKESIEEIVESVKTIIRLFKTKKKENINKVVEEYGSENVVIVDDEKGFYEVFVNQEKIEENQLKSLKDLENKNHIIYK